MAKVMVPLADGFEEIEAITIVDVLRRAGITVDTVGIVGTQITGAHGIRVNADKRLIDVSATAYDGIILPGGNPGYVNLGRSQKLIELIKQMNALNKLVAAICGAPMVLAKAGVLENRKATIYPGMEKELPRPRDDRVIVDGNIVTSQAAGTAMEFAITLVQILAGRETASRTKKDLVFKD